MQDSYRFNRLLRVCLQMNGTNNSGITDVDYRLIGLSPQYWSHTPILIGDLVSLPLVNGVDCLVTTCSDDESTTVCEGVQDDTNNSHVAEDITDVDHDDAIQIDPNNETTPHILPLSKVLLRGIATAIDRRPNGCTLLVLDDGSGSIDCRYWDNDDSSGNNSAFNLPALLAEHEPTNKQRHDNCRFLVGDMLEVMGKIKTLTAGSKANADDCKLSSQLAPHSTTTPLDVRYGCIREVHASSVCLINKGETRMANQWNGEMIHWLKCMNFNKQQCNSMNKQSRVRNGKDILPLLGDAISTSILGDGTSSDCIILDKANGNNNILHRKCCQTSHRFKSSFFYCHCEASLETLDPNLQFRDALLNRLLDMEAKLQCISDSLYPTSAEDCLDLLGIDQTNTLPPPLLFTFESIYRDEEIMSVATSIVSSTSAPEANAQRLIRKTFAALTNDGILSLYDHEQDLYLLVTRSRIIEPFLRSSGLESPSLCLFCCVLWCLQYEDSAIRILHLNLVCLYAIAFASCMY